MRLGNVWITEILCPDLLSTEIFHIFARLGPTKTVTTGVIITPISMAITPVTHSFSPFIAATHVTPFINGFWAHLVLTNLECVGPQDPLFSDLCSQLMVNCWFGARWFGFLGSPCERDCYLGGYIPVSNPKPPGPKPPHDH